MYLYAFLPAESLWRKPFLEWTTDDWQNGSNQSTLWLMKEGKVVSKRGLVSLKEIRKTLPQQFPE